MTPENDETATMAPRSGKQRDRVSDYTNLPAAAPNHNDLNSLEAGDNAARSGPNGKESVEFSESLSNTDEVDDANDDEDTNTNENENNNKRNQKTNYNKRNKENWERFSLRNNFGNWRNQTIRRKESKKARKKRLKSQEKTPSRRKKKDKPPAQLRREIFQSHITTNGITYNDAEAYGDGLQKKQTQTTQVAFQNAHCFPEHATYYKSRNIVSHLVECEYDVWLTCEVGLCWRKLLAADQWEERTFGKLHDTTSIFAYNTTEPSLEEKIQYGGVGIVASTDIKHSIVKRGKDPSGMGRWAWIRSAGKEGHYVRYVSAYRPCESGGAGSVFHQHSRALGKKDDFRNPRTAMLEDLSTAIAEWKREGDHIVLGMDANEDVRGGEVDLFMKQVSMREVILELHRDSSPPATYNRNNRRQPIDGLWATPGITISRGGYLAFGEGIPSDHRGLWFDVEFSVAFGHCPPTLAPPQPKRLKVKDPRVVEKYRNKANKTISKTGYYVRCQEVAVKAQEGWDDSLEGEYNVLQQENTRIRDEAATKIRKLTMGGVPWSPILQAIRDKIELWAMLIRRKQQVKVSVRRIRRFLENSPIQNAFTCSLQEAYTQKKLAHAEYKETREKAPELRSKFQDTLAVAIAEKKGTDAETEAKNLKRIELQRRQARNVKRMRGRLGNSRVTKLWYTNDEGSRILCNTQHDMEFACFQENETQFSQSENTPPMMEPTVSELGYLAETLEADQILQGCYDPPEGTDKYMIELLEELRMPQTIREGIKEHGFISTEISESENKQGWQKRKLASAEPSGLSMDHYAVGCEDKILNSSDTFLRQLPYRFGFSPVAWQTITDVEILKKAGIYDVELMRTIQLMHSEFNMNNKKLGRDMMSFAESCRALAPEQFGSRKNHQAILAALNKRLTNDLLRQRRLAGALCANDAKSCYDRIAHNVAILAIRRLGMPAAPVTSMFKTL